MIIRKEPIMVEVDVLQISAKITLQTRDITC